MADVVGTPDLELVIRDAFEWPDNVIVFSSQLLAGPESRSPGSGGWCPVETEE